MTCGATAIRCLTVRASYGPGQMVRRHPRLRFPGQRRVDGDVLVHFSVLQRAWPAQPARRRDGRMHRRAAGARPAGAQDHCRSTSATALPDAGPAGPCFGRARRPQGAWPMPRASLSRWRSNGSTASRAMASSTGPARARRARTSSSTWRRCAAEIDDLQPGQQLEARIAEGRKGLTAVELRERLIGRAVALAIAGVARRLPALRLQCRCARAARRPGSSKCR